jgi:hypothetical protein
MAGSVALAQTPTFSGKGKVHQAIDSKKGALFDIGGGITMLFPKGLPVGSSRLVTLKKGRGKATKAAKGFRALGPMLEFDGAFNTAGKPIVLSVPMKKDPSKAGNRIVLAMEIATFCEGKNKGRKLKSGLCAGWELHDATHEAGHLVAKLRSTGGMRMQFGLVPEDAGDE